jgi:hypothetical protein
VGRRRPVGWGRRRRRREMAAGVEEVPDEERGGTVGMQIPPESPGMHAQGVVAAFCYG